MSTREPHGPLGSEAPWRVWNTVKRSVVTAGSVLQALTVEFSVKWIITGDGVDEPTRLQTIKGRRQGRKQAWATRTG
jgi:hypothetical protein